MPLFEFRCAKCRKNFEFLSLPGRSNEKPICPTCGGKKVKKMLSSFRMGRGGSADVSASSSSGSSCGGCSAKSCKSCH